ncbi:glycoside hydrolase family 3 N-terminal domain-containing protein [Maribacter sp. MAR_2009_72]|uniref:glycoside hydrolase family 3 N-terminal domain-containing protein n=1 Tax=Maribacter sp. MAR_2009_72 TaxID=1250050 RepID=UPI00119C1DBE|nr:glycoside hydrolase family 3 N-terminal domain-containing protein [Maribacter sp. MAR_2009_72]TVZ14923.1 beta-glucosidase [Maribacter sp. MAR_2009_72]
MKEIELLFYPIITFIFLAFVPTHVAAQDYMNSNLPVEDRVEDLLSRMTVKEKVAQLNSVSLRISAQLEEGFSTESQTIHEQLANGIGMVENTLDHNLPAESVAAVNRIQKYLKEETRLGIPAIVGSEALHGHAGKNSTVFPTPLAMACSWNMELVEQAFNIIGREARIRGANEAHSPVLDIGRDPRWGRIEETYGEDTYLTTRMAKAAIAGMQGGTNGNPAKTHIIASPKHFAGYGQVTGGRNFAHTEIDEKVFIDEILPPFKAAIQESGALGIMASHCEVGGVPAHGNKWLLTDLLRNEWGFKGIVVSDYNDIKRLEEFHHVVATVEDAAALALNAGMDVDLPSGVAYRSLEKVIEKKPYLLSNLDRSVGRILRLKFMLGLFENTHVDAKMATELSGCEEHVKVAEQLATESITLLKNRNNLLPLNEKKLKTIAVIGPNAKSHELGVYAVPNDNTVSILEGLKERVGNRVNIIYEEGCKIARFSKNGQEDIFTEYSLLEENESIEKAVNAAKASDVAIVCIGGTVQESKEAAYAVGIKGDRATLDLLGNQKELVMRIAATGKPIIIVLMGGKPYAIPEIVQKTDAMLSTFYLGQTNGSAVSRVLFGEDNPSGKLAISFPASVGQIPIHYSQKANGFYKDYVDLDTQPVFAFGHGLSYTNFTYSDLKIAKESFEINEEVTFRLRVKNTGEIAGAEVVQVYFRDMVASVTRPNKLLVRFKKLWLEPGEEKTVLFTLKPTKDLSFTGIDMEKTCEPGEFKLMIGGASNDIQLEGNFWLK